MNIFLSYRKILKADFEIVLCKYLGKTKTKSIDLEFTALTQWSDLDACLEGLEKGKMNSIPK